MIDVENIVFSTVTTALRAAFPGPPAIFVSSELTAVPSSFPAAMGSEEDNATHTATLGSSMTENHSDLMYQWEAYSNLLSGRKAQCKSIMAVIDSQMIAFGFVRIGKGPIAVPNMDATKYRMVARYRGVVGKTIAGTADKYQVYRR